LPRQPQTVSAARRLLGPALAGVGVIDGCRGDILLALTEACSNAVEHARWAPDFEMIVTVNPRVCVVEVIDHGSGADVARLHAVPDLLAPRGRGLRLIRAVTDRLELIPVDPHGLAVRMTKTLAWVAGAPLTWVAAHVDPWALVDV
jgi:serine/threonine-protein kinase RsbW